MKLHSLHRPSWPSQSVWWKVRWPSLAFISLHGLHRFHGSVAHKPVFMAQSLTNRHCWNCRKCHWLQGFHGLHGLHIFHWPSLPSSWPSLPSLPSWPSFSASRSSGQICHCVKNTWKNMKKTVQWAWVKNEMKWMQVKCNDRGVHNTRKYGELFI